jgi:hypothetical protein
VCGCFKEGGSAVQSKDWARELPWCLSWLSRLIGGFSLACTALYMYCLRNESMVTFVYVAVPVYRALEASLQQHTGMQAHSQHHDTTHPADEPFGL